MTDSTLDLAGLGVGPFNLSIAALLDTIPAIRAGFFDRKPEFSWHPGMSLPGARLQTSCLKDLVSRLVNSLTYCETLAPLAKAPVRRCGGSTSRIGNTGPEAPASRPAGAPDSLESGVAPARFGTTKPSLTRLALKAVRGSVDQRIDQTGH